MTVDGQQWTTNGRLTNILFINAILLLLGRGWQHLADSVPVRALLWNEDLFRPLIENLTTLEWSGYVANLQYDHWISYLTYGFGFFYLLLAFSLIMIKIGGNLKLPPIYRMLKISLLLTSIFFFILAFCYYLDKNYLLGQWGEYALQWMSPLFLSWYIFKTIPRSRLVLLMKIALSITFICHGLYAIGYYPVPGSFQSMLMQILPLTETQAISILKVAGILDFILSIVIFIPQRKIVLVALAYAAIWGFLTALARPVAHFYSQFWLESLLQWTPEFLFRVPHFLIPIWLFLFTYHRVSPPHSITPDLQSLHQ
ncbi:MAG: hypothetical protein AB8G22_15055 [Saprospiraceae bacterium]